MKLLISSETEKSGRATPYGGVRCANNPIAFPRHMIALIAFWFASFRADYVPHQLTTSIHHGHTSVRWPIAVRRARTRRREVLQRLWPRSRDLDEGRLCVRGEYFGPTPGLIV